MDRLTPADRANELRDLLVAATQRSAWSLAPHTRCVRVTAHPAVEDEFAPEQASGWLTSRW